MTSLTQNLTALTPVGTAELGARANHSMNVNVAVDDRYVYATHSYVPIKDPKHYDGTGELVVLDRTTLVEVARLPVNIGPFRVAVDRVRRRAFVLGYATADLGKDSIVVVDTNTLTVAGVIGPQNWGLLDLAVDTAAGKVFAVNQAGGKLFVYDSTTLAQTGVIDVGLKCMAMAVDETRGRIYLAQTTVNDNSVVVVDTAAGVVTQRVLLDPSNTVVQDVAVDPGRDEAYIISQGNAHVGQTGPTVFVFTPSTGAVRSFPLTKVGRSIEVDPAIGQLYTAGENHVEAVDPITGTIREQATFPGYPGRMMALDPDTGLLYVGENATGRVVAYRSALPHPPPPAGPPTLSVSCNGFRMNLFRQAADGSVETADWREELDWHTFLPIAPPPGAVFPPGTRFASLSPEAGRWWLFGVDTAGVMWGTSGLEQASGFWHQIGTGFVPGAEIAWAAPFEAAVTLYAADATGTVRSFGFSEAGPQGEAVHPGITVTPGAPISAVSRKAGHWDLFVLHPDGRVYTQWWSTDEDDFSNWGAVADQVFVPGTRISSLGRKTDQLDLFAVRPDGWLVSTFWNNEIGDWNSWLPVADGWGFPAGAPVAVTNANGNNITLFAVGIDAQLWTTYWHKEDGWATWTMLGGPAAAPGAAVTAVRRAEDEVDVCWLAPDGKVGHSWWNRFQDGWSIQHGVNRRVGAQSLFNIVEVKTDKPVKGNVRVTIWDDGSYLVKGHMHGSGFDPYDFIVNVTIPVDFADPTYDDFVAHTAYKAGHVDGWEPFGDEERSFDWVDVGDSYEVGAFFKTLQAGGSLPLVLSKAVKNVGIGGALQSLIDDVIGTHLLTDVVNTVGGTLVMAVAIGREMEHLFGVDLGDNGWLGFSILTLANQQWLVIPAANVILPTLPFFEDPAIVGKARPMSPEEWSWAVAIFGDTLPLPDDIIITNLKDLRDKPFSSTDGERYLVHMGNQAFDSPTTDVDTAPGGGSTAPGELFVHELTHVWDASHSGLLWEAEAAVAQIDRPDSPPASDREWTELGIEDKAMAVAHWYRLYHLNLNSADAQNDPYYHYIRDHLRTGSN